MKRTFLLLSLTTLFLAAKSQVRVTFKNTSNFSIKVYTPISSVLDSIPPKGQTIPLVMPAVSTNQELIVSKGDTEYHVNSNRSVEEVVHTSGNYLLTLTWNPKKNKFTAILKPL